MSPSLSDFDSKELQTLLNALAAYTVDLKNKIEIQEHYNIDLGFDYREELERVELLVTQTINAKVEVVTRERIQSN